MKKWFMANPVSMDTNQKNGDLCRFTVCVICTNQFLSQTSPSLKTRLGLWDLCGVFFWGGGGGGTRDMAELTCICYSSIMPFAPLTEALTKCHTATTAQLICELKEFKCLLSLLANCSYKMNESPQKSMAACGKFVSCAIAWIRGL